MQDYKAEAAYLLKLPVLLSKGISTLRVVKYPLTLTKFTL